MGGPDEIDGAGLKMDLEKPNKTSLKEYKIKIDDLAKLIVKLSEGSVRDALSLLDRGMLVENNGKEGGF